MKFLIPLIAVPALAAALGCGTGGPQQGVDAATIVPAPGAQEPAKPAEKAPAAKPQKPQTPPKPAEPVNYAEHAFPPTMPDTDWHQDAWMRNDCMRCHETGVGNAPEVVHADMPDILLVAKCRTCHILIPGQKPKAGPKLVDDSIAARAFPPMMPASESHMHAWSRDDCLLCHENGVKGAPQIVHKGMPSRLLSAKCRTCHVQVRAVEATENSEAGH